MINICICDNDKEITLKLMKIVSSLDELHHFDIQQFHETASVLNSRTCFDLCILDIDLPDADGIVLAEHVKKINEDALIIFYSKMDHLVFESFKVHPFDFIRKSEDDENLIRKLSKAIHKVKDNNSFYIWSCRRDTSKIAYKDIVYFYKTLNDLNICTVNKDYTQRKALKDISYPNYFYKVSSSLVINMRYLRSVTDNQLYFENGQHFTLSRVKLRELKKKYILFLSDEGV